MRNTQKSGNKYDIVNKLLWNNLLQYDCLKLIVDKTFSNVVIYMEKKLLSSTASRRKYLSFLMIAGKHYIYNIYYIYAFRLN